MFKGMGGKSPANIAHFLEGIDYPASKEDIINYAEDKNAPDEVLDVLEEIPDKVYNSMSDLMQGVGKAE